MTNEEDCEARREQLIKAWQNITNRRSRPLKQIVLLDLLKDFMEYPREEIFVPIGLDLHDAGKKVDLSYDEFAQSAINLSRTLDTFSRHQHILSTLMDERCPLDEREALRTTLQQIEHLLPLIQKLPARPGASGRRVVEPIIKHLVAIIAWYVLVVEKGRFRRTFTEDDDTPKSREAILACATIEGLGYHVSGAELNGHMKSVNKIFKSLSYMPCWYEIIMFWPPRSVPYDYVHLHQKSRHWLLRKLQRYKRIRSKATLSRFGRGSSIRRSRSAT